MFRSRFRGIWLACAAPMAWSLCGMELTGCLLPPPVEEIEIPPNNPPRILPDRVSPVPSDGPVEISVLCPPTFSAQLFDPDGDPLYWRVFVDYHVGINRTPKQSIQEPDPTGNPVPIAFTPNTDELGPDDTHQVELFIADRSFLPAPLDNTGRGLDDGGEGITDYVTWTVLVDPVLDGECPP